MLGLLRVALLLHSQEGHRANAVNICIGMTVTVSTRGTGSRQNPGPMKRWPSTGNHDLIRSRPGPLQNGARSWPEELAPMSTPLEGWAAQRPRIATSYTTNAKLGEGREALRRQKEPWRDEQRRLRGVAGLCARPTPDVARTGINPGGSFPLKSCRLAIGEVVRVRARA